MNLTDKIKSSGFWISLAGAVVIFLQTLGVKIDAPGVNAAVTALCSVMIVLGVLTSGGTGGSDAPAAPAEDEEPERTEVSAE